MWMSITSLFARKKMKRCEGRQRGRNNKRRKERKKQLIIQITVIFFHTMEYYSPIKLY